MIAPRSDTDDQAWERYIAHRIARRQRLAQLTAAGEQRRGRQGDK